MKYRSSLIFKNIFFVFMILLVVFLSGCSKNETTNNIPVISVNFVINPNSTEYIELNVVNGWVYLTGGYRGIIVFRKSPTEFVAFERACPYDWQQSTARLEVEAAGTTGICPSCKSKFILVDGSPFAGPTQFPLKQYQTNYDGNLLYVYN